MAFASSVAVLVIGSFASFGGISYAAAGATNSYDVVKKIAVHHRLTVKHSSARDQYGTPSTNVNTGAVAAASKPATPKPTGAVQAQTQTLPFTGFSLLGTVVFSLVLIGAGIALRRRESRA